MKPKEPTPTPATKRALVTDCTQFASTLAFDLMNQTFTILPKYVEFGFFFGNSSKSNALFQCISYFVQEPKDY